MKLRKGILFITLLFFITLIMGQVSTVKAVQTGTTMNLTIRFYRDGTQKYGYELSTNGGNSNSVKVHEIYKSDDDKHETIYCIKGGRGFGSENMDTSSSQLKAIEYKKSYDLKNEESKQQYLSDLSLTDENFRGLLWVLDNCAIKKPINASDVSDENSKLSREFLIHATKKYCEEKEKEILDEDIFDELTEADIDVVQQAAIWHFTNSKDNTDASNGYSKFSVDQLTLWMTKEHEQNHQSMSSISPERSQACGYIFDYLIHGMPEDYDYTNTETNPVKMSDDTNQKVVYSGGRYILGPYKIEETQDAENREYELEWSLEKDQQKIEDVILLNSNKREEKGKTLKDYVGQDFYISIPSSEYSNSEQHKFTLKVKGSFLTTKATYWTVANPGNNDQPVVVIEKQKQEFNLSKDFQNEVKQDEEYFDLALRKFIVSINGKEPTTSREPVVPETELEKLREANNTKSLNPEETTAQKNHTKTPLEVQTGDKVIYTIRIYNEGTLDGYATEITDYLPEGLTLASNSSINTKYGWKPNRTNSRIVTTKYLEKTLLEAFDGATLDYEDIQIECIVNATTEGKESLKNIAEITEQEDENGNPEDRDSTPDNVKRENYGTTSQEDDDDFEDLKLVEKPFDLSLRKFITTVQSGDETKKYDRAPKVDTSKLVAGTSTTATYNHPKNPVGVKIGDIVTYTIRVYNEGEVDGYVTEIKDHLPPQLEFIVDDDLNLEYGWIISADGRTVTTDITSPTTQNNANRDEIYASRTKTSDKVLLKAFNGGTSLDYIDVQIRCKVKDNINIFEKITNIADIADFVNDAQKPVKDRDSQEDNVTVPSDDNLPEYKDPEIESGKDYIPGQQDDDDFEKLVIQNFDLALRKFITKVNDKDITSRVPAFEIDEDGNYKYVHPKDPITVANGNIVIYTLRIFNEGNIAGYASEIKDDLPEGLTFLPTDSTNVEYRWTMYTEDGTKTDDVNEAKYIKTDYLSKEQEQNDGDNLLKAFDKETMTMPDYRDVKIAFRVTEPNTSDRIITNIAEITDDRDEDNKPVEDTDSEPDNDTPDEDDIDEEHLQVKYFDLSLKKWVSESIVTYKGKTTVTKTGHTGDENPEPVVKVEVRQTKLSQTTVKFRFVIKVTNEGEIEGYAKEITDYVPQGLVFRAADNPLWKEKDGKVVTDQLKDKLLQPGESATVEIVLTWVNGVKNLGEKVNWAEISDDDNPYDAPDIDSTPGNNKKGEDDIDDAPVILSITTGVLPTYVTLTLGVVAIIATGVILIKKFVM